jgi:dihydropteroate synthase
MPAPYTLMGLLNVTPESVDEFGAPFDVDGAIRRGVEMLDAGAGIVDVGGESTRVLEHDVPVGEELRRVVPVIEGLAAERPGATISIDTTKASVARAALVAGASYVNDVSAWRFDAEMLPVIAEHGAACCAVHMRGTPRTMAGYTHYDDLIADVRWFLQRRVERAVAAGIPVERIDVDPGIGLAKSPRQDLELLGRLDAFTSIGPRVMVGTSRKAFVAELTGHDDAQQQLAASVATNVLALHGGAGLFRVHDVGLVRDALEMASHMTADRTAPVLASA